MPIKIANNASGTLATAISASDTGIVLTTGNGAEFPTLAAGEYFYATLSSSGGTQELVKATARSGDSLTVVRAQGGTSAAGFAAGSRFELRVTTQSIVDTVYDISRYQGASATNPTTRLNGEPLLVGDFYFNTGDNSLRFYNGASWQSVVSGSISIQQFSGNGVTTAFSFSTAPSVEAVTQVYINGVYQQKDTYTLVGTTLTFSQAPVAGTGNIEVVVIEAVAIGTLAAPSVTYSPAVTSLLTAVDVKNALDDLSHESTGSTKVGFIQAGTGAVSRTAQAKMRDVVNVKDFGCVCDGVTDDRVNFQKAIDALTPYSTLVAEGSILLGTHVNLKKSHVVYDFRAAKFILPGTGGTAYGAGLLIGDSTAPTPLLPIDVTLLGGEYYPAGNSAVYPTADFNPIAIITGAHIQVIGARVFPKQSVRAISVQTDNTVSATPGPFIDGVYITGLEVYGDGNAVDGVDIGYAGAADLIRNVYVQGAVFGCKRGVHTYTSNSSTDQMIGLTLDLDIHNPTVAAGELSATQHAKLNLRVRGATAAGFDIVQFSDSECNLSIQGSGASLGTAVHFRQAAAGTYGNVVNCNISTSDSNNWAIGLYPQTDYAVYPSVNIEDATLGIKMSGFKSDFGNVVFRNCTTEIDFPFNLADSWGDVVSFGSGANPVISRRTFNSSSGSALYGIDLHNQATITLAAGATAQIFGAVAEFSGMLLVNGTGGIGDPALYVMGGAVSYLVGGASAVYSAASGTASKVNVYYDGSLIPTVQNNTAGSVTLRFFAIRMRNSP